MFCVYIYIYIYIYICVCVCVCLDFMSCDLIVCIYIALFRDQSWAWTCVRVPPCACHFSWFWVSKHPMSSIHSIYSCARFCTNTIDGKVEEPSFERIWSRYHRNLASDSHRNLLDSHDVRMSVVCSWTPARERPFASVVGDIPGSSEAFLCPFGTT